MMDPLTWRDILAAMVAVRDAAWVGLRSNMSKPRLNIGMVGYGFMGKAHSNAYRRVANFFDVPYEPVLKAVCARNRARVETFQHTWGYESIEIRLAATGRAQGH